MSRHALNLSRPFILSIAPFVAISLLASISACDDGYDGRVSAGSRRDAPADLSPDAPDVPIDDGSSAADSSTTEREPVDRILREGAVGEITLIIDGDTVHVTVNGWYNVVRLQGINTPECEKGMADTPWGRQFVCIADQEWWGLAAYEVLLDRAAGAQVTVRCDQAEGEACPLDSFDRYLAFLEDDQGDLGEWLLRNGHGMSFTKYYSSRRATYCAAEDAAIAAGIGMWSLGDRDEVIGLMNESTQDWYSDRDALCAEALGE